MLYMYHIAIMKKSWDLIPKILNGQKTIESRWYKTKRSPYDKIKLSETVYFKNTGEAVTAKAEVSKVLQYRNLTPERIYKLIDEFGGEGKIHFPNLTEAKRDLVNKKYCVLIFLKDSKMVKPFKINKSGFGAMSAWICVADIRTIKTSP